MISKTFQIAAATLAGLMLVGMVDEASAATASKIYRKGHGYGGYNRQGYAYHRRYRNPAAGAAVAGAALGIIGLAAGAAATNRYDDGYGYGGYGYGDPGYGYGAPGYGYAPYGYGYSPD